jgi:hypothetical protein
MDQAKKKTITGMRFADAGTEAEYKCSTCGNMYPVANAECDVCGHRCSEDTCQIIKVSNQDY